jgi:Flp pilus assembly protein TadB
MRADTLRLCLIGVLAAAAIAAPFVDWAAFILFVAAMALFLRWRRAALQERRASVFDREAKTVETGTRTDQ